VTIKYQPYFNLVVLVSLIISSIVFLKYNKTHLMNKKEKPVKTTMFKIPKIFQFLYFSWHFVVLYNLIPIFITHTF